MDGYNVVPSAIQRRIMGLGVPQDEEVDPNMLVPDPDSEEAMALARPSDPLVGQTSSVEPSGIEAVTPKYGPESSAYLQKLKEMPQKAQFGKPSKTRKGLGVLAGIGTTILGGGIAGGINEAKAVMEDPYRSALQDYYQNLEQNKTAAGVETGQIGTQTKAQEMIANRIAAQERAAQYRANAERFRYMTSLPYQEFQKELARIRHAGTPKPFQIVPPGSTVLNEKGEVVHVANPRPGNTALDQSMRAHKILLAEESEPGSQDPSELAAAKQFVEDKVRSTTAYTDIVRTKEKELGRPLTSAEKSAITLPETAQRPPQILAVTPENRVINVRPGGTLPPGTRTVQQEGQMNTPTTFFRGRMESAQGAITAGDNLIKFVQQNKNSLGNVDNYWKQLMQGTPVADPTVAHFIGQVQSWAALQGAAHGMRSGTIMKEFEDRLGKGPKNPDAIIAAIQGVNEGLSSIANYGKEAPANNALPGGITLDQINAEIARRKAKK